METSMSEEWKMKEIRCYMCDGFIRNRHVRASVPNEQLMERHHRLEDCVKEMADAIIELRKEFEAFMKETDSKIDSLKSKKTKKETHVSSCAEGTSSSDRTPAECP